METIKTTKKVFSKIGLSLFFGTLIILVVQSIGMAIAANVPFIASNGDLSFLVMQMPMYIIAFPLIFLMLKRVPKYMSDDKKKMSTGQFIAAFFMTFAATYVLNWVAMGITYLIGFIKQGEVNHVMNTVTGSISLPMNLVVIAIIAPIMEELLFRKALIDRTVQFGEGIALVFSGLVFGLFHGNLVQFSYAFLLGAFFGFIYLKTKNIIYPIILHILTNLFGSFVSTLVLEMSGLNNIASDANTAEVTAALMENIPGMLIYCAYMLFLFAGVIAGVVLFIKNRKKFHLQPGTVTIEKGTRFKTMILNVGVILYSIFWIAMIISQLLA